MRYRMMILVLVGCLLLGLAACAEPQVELAEPEPPQRQEPTGERQEVVPVAFTPETWPRIDGSTATIPLGEALVSVFLAIPRDQAAAYAAFHGTYEAYENLRHKQTDLLLVYEAPAAVDTQQLEFAPIGRDALVFLINVQNPVQDLSTAQIQAVYQGQISNWQELGGEDAEIRAFQRNATSGSQTLMEKLVMEGLELMPPEENYTVSSMSGLMGRLAEYNNGEHAIGYNVYYFVSQMNPDPLVQLLAVDGVSPSNETIRSGAYPFVNDFYAVIRADEPEDSPTRLLFEWLQGEQGQALVAAEGYVPIH